MKVLQVHNFYRQSGGEDAVVAAEKALLESYGHEVRQFTVDNNAMSFMQRISVAYHLPYSRTSREAVAAVIRDFCPDIVHVHNFFPRISPSVFDACRIEGVPVVQTLHNFRHLCPGALLMRKGRPCEDCLESGPYRAVARRCYRRSFWGTVAVARMIKRHRDLGTWQNKVQAFIVLSAFAKNIFVRAGLPDEKLFIKSNFAREPAAPTTEKERFGLFVGRMSEEKGVLTLLRAWRSVNERLVVVGDGPLTPFIRQSGLSQITCSGRLPADEVQHLMKRAAFLITPSECYENFPVVIAEAYAAGTPVIASRIGSLPELVQDGETGLLIEPGDHDALANAVRWAFLHLDRLAVMGRNAHSRYLQEYTPHKNYSRLIEIFSAVSSSPL